MYADEPTWKSSPSATGLILILIMISPLGSPMLLWFVVSLCPNEIETGRQCFVPDGLSFYLAYSTFVPLFAFGYLGVLWWAMSFVSLVTFGWFFIRAAWCRMFPL